jgi:predicted nucleic acid-binding protein
MTEKPRLYLDANVFIAAFEAGHPSCFRLFTDSRRSSGPPLFTSVLTKAELLVKPLREANDRLAEMYENWTVRSDILEVGEVEDQVERFAAVLRAQNQSLKLPDAIHLSTAIGFACTHFVTFDRALAKVRNVVHERWAWSRSRTMPTHISPDESGFDELLSAVCA